MDIVFKCLLCLGAIAYGCMVGGVVWLILTEANKPLPRRKSRRRGVR